MYFGVPQFLDKTFTLPDGRLAGVGFNNDGFAVRLEFGVQTSVGATSFSLEFSLPLDGYTGTDTQAIDTFIAMVNNWIGSNYP